MSIANVQATIEGFLSSHLSVEKFELTREGSKSVRLKRYLIDGERPVGHEHTLTTMQNIWVRRDDVRLGRLRDVSHVIKTAAELANKESANSNLFAVPQFNGCDLIRFGVRTPAEAVRVLSEVSL